MAKGKRKEISDDENEDEQVESGEEAVSTDDGGDKKKPAKKTVVKKDDNKKQKKEAVVGKEEFSMDKKKISKSVFKGVTRVDFRNMYEKNGENLPTQKGIAFTKEEWNVIKKNIPLIDSWFE